MYSNYRLTCENVSFSIQICTPCSSQLSLFTAPFWLSSQSVCVCVCVPTTLAGDNTVTRALSGDTRRQCQTTRPGGDKCQWSLWCWHQCHTADVTLRNKIYKTTASVFGCYIWLLKTGGICLKTYQKCIKELLNFIYLISYIAGTCLKT